MDLSMSVLVLASLLPSLSEAASVLTQSGEVRGGRSLFQGLQRNGSLHTFQGIPYAEPPTGRLRLLAPVPVRRWEGSLDVSGEPGAQCLQPAAFSQQILGDEDCLFLNIYTELLPQPASHIHHLRPVFFWIHGGSFKIGSGTFKGMNMDLLVEAGLVVVTVNYRLGPLGFLALPGTAISGNQGLKDQLLALRWVKQNIANFGGDPSRITVAGMSAGGISVHAHILSPWAADDQLFHAGISFSGTMLMGGSQLISRGLESSRKFLEDQCHIQLEPGRNLTELLEQSCLYSLPASQLVGRANDFEIRNLTLRERVEQNRVEYFFWPVIDYWAASPYLPCDPVTTLKNQKQKKVPYMTGGNANEGAFFTAPNWRYLKEEDNQVQEFWDVFGGHLMFFKDFKPTYEEKLFSRMVAQFYFGGLDGITRGNKDSFTALTTDAYFSHPNQQAVKLHAQSAAPVYNYLMTYRGSVSLSFLFAAGDPEAKTEDFGVSHADDLLYTFKLDLGKMSALNTEDDRKFAANWISLISNFVKYGNPTPLTDAPTFWRPAQLSERSEGYLDINLQNAEKLSMFPERMEFWSRVL